MIGESQTKSKNEDIVQFPLSLLKKVGFYFEKWTWKVVLLTAIHTTVLLLLVLNAMLQLLTVKGDISEFVLNSEALSSFAQVLVKVVAFTLQQTHIIDLIQRTDHFWHASSCAGALRSYLNVMAFRTLKLQKCFFICALVTVLSGYVSVLLGRSMPLGTWNLEGHVWLRHLTLNLQIIAWPFYGLFIIAFDSLFLGFCIKVIIQFRILRQRLANLDTFNVIYEKCPREEKLASYIKHHIFLLRFCRAFQDTYSLTVLIEYGTITSIFCLQMYAIFESKGALLRVRYGLSLTVVFLQLAFYCVSVDYISSEAENLADAIFYSKWRSSAARKPITLIIQQAQRRITFTAGGLVHINVRTLLIVLRVSWSVCTLMRQLKEKS